MVIIFVQSFVTKDHVIVVEKLFSKSSVVIAARLYFSLRCLAELPHPPVGSIVNDQGSAAIQEYLTAAMATTRFANALFSHRNLAYVERRR